jgi:pSer/pThr/pTyr-binding forkhead associated (FHA) protein
MAETWLELPSRHRHGILGPCVLGRSQGCDLQLEGSDVSRRHAMVNPQAGGEYWLVDLGSTNGSLLNGRRVSRPTRLRDGDQLQIGTHRLVFHQPDAPAFRTGSGEETQLLTQARVRVEPAWLLLADIVGSTALARRLAPDAMAREIGGWLRACGEIFERERLAIQVFLGDGFLTYQPTHPEATARLLRVWQALAHRQAGASPPYRLILHQAEITLGGTAPGGIEQVLGPGVNYLFRMEKVAAQLKEPRLLTRAALAAWPAPSPAVRSLGHHVLAGFEGQHEALAPAG